MAVISYEDVKASVGELYKAGKEFPQKEMFYAVPQDKRAAKAAEIMQDTIKSIADTFVKQKIGVKQWQQATEAAKISAEKVITPRMMQEALTRVQQEYVAQNIEAVQQEKREEREMLCGADTACQLLRWGYMQMGAKREIMPYMPQENQITDFILRNKISAEMARKYRTVIRAFLNDYNYSQQEHAEMSCKLVIRREANELELVTLGYDNAVAMRNGGLRHG